MGSAADRDGMHEESNYRNDTGWHGFHAVIFDLGGVFYPSHHEVFASYERDAELRPGVLSHIVSERGELGAWAALERGELTVDEFIPLLEKECRSARCEVNGRELMSRIARTMYPRPSMIDAAHQIRAHGYKTGIVTNNWIIGSETTGVLIDSLEVADVIVESSLEGIRKPDSRLYSLACARLAVAPQEIICLDDTKENLEVAAEMGMTTMQVDDPHLALEWLGHTLGIQLAA